MICIMQIQKSKLQSIHVVLIVLEGGNDFGEEIERKTEVETRNKKLKNGDTADKIEVSKEMIKIKKELGINQVFKLRKVAFDSGILTKDLRNTFLNCIKVKERGQSIKHIGLLRIFRKPCKGSGGQSKQHLGN